MQGQKVLWQLSVIILVSSAMLICGCAAGTNGTSATQTQAAASTSNVELLLLKAGFETVPNEHPICTPVCQRMPSGQIVPFKRGSQTVYGYRSVTSGRLLVGTEAEYQQFINLAVMQKLDESQRPTLASPSNDPQFWIMWQDLYGGH